MTYPQPILEDKPRPVSRGAALTRWSRMLYSPGDHSSGFTPLHTMRPITTMSGRMTNDH